MHDALVGSERTNIYPTINKHSRAQPGDLIFANLITYTLWVPNKMMRRLILLRYSLCEMQWVQSQKVFHGPRACVVYTEAASYCQNLLILLRIEDELYIVNK
jgi:hypothetical protein